MKSKTIRSTSLVSSALAIIAGLTLASHVSAQIGTGWREYSPGRTIQIAHSGAIGGHPYSNTKLDIGGGHYLRQNGIETFRLTDNSSNRVEIRVNNDYTTGQRQFQGELRVSTPTDNESTHQIFGRNNDLHGPLIMLRADKENGGTLSKQGGNVIVATGVYGKFVRVNTLHNTANGGIQIYINGSKKMDTTGAKSTVRHYTKYGVYGTLQTSSAKTEWRNVRFFQK